jgi:hypothetical protein
VNGAGYDRIELTASRECDRFFQRRRGSTRGFGGRISWPRTGIFADDFAFSGGRNAIGIQSEIDDFRANSCAIAKRNPDAWLITCPHAVIVIEPYLIDQEDDYEHGHLRCPLFR